VADFLPDDPDAELVAAAGEGDGDAFEALVRRYQGRIIGLARGYTRNPADAEDLAQDVFVRLYRSLRRFRGDSLFRTWLYTVALNVVRSHHASRGRREPVWGDSGADAQRAFDPPDGAPDAEITFARREAIERALRELPPDLREAVMLRDVHGLDSDEVCEVLGLSAANQRVLLHRGRAKLRALLESYYRGHEEGVL